MICYDYVMSDKSKNSKLIPDDLLVEYGEIGVKGLIKETERFLPALNDLSTDIPYVKTIVAAVKFPRTLSDFLLGKKVSAFLYSSGLDEAKLERFKKKFDHTKQERLWERVVFSINAHDDKQKSDLVGKLFAALVNESINEDEFFEMVHATNSLNLNMLDKLKKAYMLSYADSLPSSLSYNFATLGLIDIDNSGIGTLGGGGPNYPLNQIGWKYIGIVYAFPASDIEGVSVGRGELVCELGKDWQVTSQAFPLEQIKVRGTKHKEVDLFVMNDSKALLCSIDTQLPICVASGVVLAGESGNDTAKRLSEKYLNMPRAIRIRNMEDEPIQKWAFVVESNELAEGLIFRSVNRIVETVTNLPNKTNYSRYLVDILTECERIVSGEI